MALLTLRVVLHPLAPLLAARLFPFRCYLIFPLFIFPSSVLRHTFPFLLSFFSLRHLLQSFLLPLCAVAHVTATVIVAVLTDSGIVVISNSKSSIDVIIVIVLLYIASLGDVDYIDI